MLKMSQMTRMSRMATMRRAVFDPEARAAERAAASRAAYAANPTATAKRVQKWRAANPHKRSAHLAVKRAMNAGDLVNPGVCEALIGVSGFICTSGKSIDAHHDDYSQPLTVLWLCRSCHRRRHSWLRSIGRNPD